MISICCPTRGRPARFARMLASAQKTATQAFEVCAWVDDDDTTRDRYPVDPAVHYGQGPREYIDGVLCTSDLWNRAWEMATGDIAMLAADDIVFRTPGWDARVENAISRVRDRIVMVYPDDGTRRKAPVLPFVSREWIEAAGGFTPPDFQGWFADQWIWQMAAELRRVVFLSDVLVAHIQRRGSDQTYRDGENARSSVGGLEGMRQRFYSAEMRTRRNAQMAGLRGAMTVDTDLVPQPVPAWFTESIEGPQPAPMFPRAEDTLVVVHAYAGDAHLVKAFLPQFLHHGCKVLVLSPTDSPVMIDHPGVECRQAGKAAYFGQTSLDRQMAHLELLLTYPQTFFLLNDADSMCLSPEIPAYLYERSETVWSNEVRETRPHQSPYPKIALQPPYFLTRESITKMLAVANKREVRAHPITPYIDWYMLALACEAGLEHRSYPNGKSFPAWKHGAIPETQELGHNFIHEQSAKGVDGAMRMRAFVTRGAVMIHSVKHPPVRDLLVAAHERYAERHKPKVFVGV